MLHPLDPKAWPRDTQEYVFLARAFEQIGRAKYAERWDESFLSNAFHEARRLMREQYGERWDQALEREHDEGEYDEKQDDGKQDNDEGADRQLFDQFLQLEEAQKKKEEPGRLAFEARNREMRENVAEEIAEQLELGNLVAATRPKSGGEFSAMKGHDWNGDNRITWIFSCQRSRSWIFLDRAKLDAHLRMARAHAGSAPYLSPYLRVMISVSEAMKIAPDNQPAKKYVERQLLKMWSGHLSEHLVSVMATLIRDPESKLGKAGKKVTKKTEG